MLDRQKKKKKRKSHPESVGFTGMTLDGREEVERVPPEEATRETGGRYLHLCATPGYTHQMTQMFAGLVQAVVQNSGCWWQIQTIWSQPVSNLASNEPLPQ